MSCLCVLLLLLGRAAGEDPPAKPAEKSQPAYLAEFDKLKADMNKVQQAMNQEYAAAKTDEEREAAVSRIQTDKGLPLADKAVALVRPHAADKEAVQVFTWVLNYQPASPAASEAAKLLAQHHPKDPQTLDTASRFSRAPMPWTEKLLQAVAKADLPPDRQVRALLALAECAKTKAEFPSLIKNLDPAMAKSVQARFGKEYLAELLALDQAKLESQAVQLFNEAAARYGSEKYGSATVADYVKSTLFELENLAIGKTAPDIEGEDIDGGKFKLSDYRGKVVVLDFWGNW